MRTKRFRAPRAAAGLPLFILLLAAATSSAQTAVYTGNYDNFRTNAQNHETVLSPSTVSAELFGKLYSLPVDGQVYAQPLVTDLVEVPGFGRRRLVLVATMRNTVYAFDADPLGSHLPVWKTNLGPPVPAANYSVGAYYEDLLPFNGILGTPVIDAATHTLYVVAATFESGAYAYRLHALNLATGQARMPPVSIQGEMESARPGEEEGKFRFDPFWHLQRPGLLLANGNVYIAFGSHGGAGPHQAGSLPTAPLTFRPPVCSARRRMRAELPSGCPDAAWPRAPMGLFMRPPATGLSTARGALGNPCCA